MEKQLTTRDSKLATHKIGWLNLPGYKGETWNPVVGCRKVSEGCRNCYALRMGNRLAGIAMKKDSPLSIAKYAMVVNNGKWNGLSFFNRPELAKPQELKQPHIIFVCSMGDLFFETHPFSDIYDVYLAMKKCPQHIFIILTKRPERMVEFYRDYAQINEVIDNIWIGTTAETQEMANQRLQYLNWIPAAVKFVSIEPMLSAIDFSVALGDTLKYHAGGLKNCLSWVICGGESGPGARPVHPDWVRSIRDQCQKAQVPFFFKQWGEWGHYRFNRPSEKYSSIGYYHVAASKCGDFISGQNINESNANVINMRKISRKANGNLLDGVKYEAYPGEVASSE